MDTQLQQALVEVIRGFTTTLSEVKAFTIAEAPDVIRQLFMWKAVQYQMMIGVFTSLIIGCVVAFFASYKTDNYEVYVPLRIISSFCLIFFVIVVIVHVFNLVQINIAPKVWLLEYAKELMVGGKQ